MHLPNDPTAPGDRHAPADEADDADAEVSATPVPGGMREVLRALPVLARVAWFSLGALVATTVTLLALLRPFARPAGAERAPPYEGFPFADNAGVCQEYVALATLRTSHGDAQAIARRLSTGLPPTLRADNLRLVRAFAPGEYWTLAVDAESGTGSAARAAAVAAELNALPGTGLHFDGVFYASRQLYDTAHVLCMPRASSTATRR